MTPASSCPHILTQVQRGTCGAARERQGRYAAAAYFHAMLMRIARGCSLERDVGITVNRSLSRLKEHTYAISQGKRRFNWTALQQ